MKDILQKIDLAFRLISSVPVSGDSVDIISAARNNLRTVYAELEKRDKEEKSDG